MKRTKKGSKSSVRVAEEMLQEVEAFTEKLQNSDYLVQFMLTLEINKIEAAHQKYDQPMIFPKETDEKGVVETFTINPMYEGKVPAPKTQFTSDEVRLVGEYLTSNEKVIKNLGVILTVAALEHMMLPMLSPEERRNATPPFEKSFNEFGFPITFKINWPVEHIGLPM